MKKKYFILALAAISMAACNNEEESMLGNVNGGAQVGKTIDPVLLRAVEDTRESMNVDLVNKWVDGDAVGIFSQWDQNKTGDPSQYVNNGAQNARYQFRNSFIYGGVTYTNRWTQDGLLEGTLTAANAVQWSALPTHVDTKYNFYVYYPYASGAPQTAVPFTLTNEQTQTTADEWANAGSSCYNFMYSSNRDVTRPADRSLPLNLVRLAPVAEFSIIRDDNSLDGYFLQNVVLTASGLKAGMCSIDLTSAAKYTSLPFAAASSVPSFTLTTASNTAVPSTGIAVSSVDLTKAFKVYMSVNNFTAGTHTVTALFSNGTDTKTITVTRATEKFEVKDGKGNLVQYYLRASDAKGTSIAPTGISVNPTSLSLAKGETATISATVYPTNTTSPGVTWTTSNSGVATVDANGKVTAIGPGTATITATDAAGHKATCTVTVTSAPAKFVSSSTAQGTVAMPTVENATLATVAPIANGYQITATSSTLTYGHEAVPTPASGYKFTGWTVSGAADAANNGTFAMGTSKSVEALYTINTDGSIITNTVSTAGITFTANFGTSTTYTVTVAAGTGGTASVSAGSGATKDGNTVSTTSNTATFTATATPSTGYTFSGWYDGTTLRSSSATLTAAVYTYNGQTLTAKFTDHKVTSGIGSYQGSYYFYPMTSDNTTWSSFTTIGYDQNNVAKTGSVGTSTILACPTPAQINGYMNAGYYIDTDMKWINTAGEEKKGGLWLKKNAAAISANYGTAANPVRISWPAALGTITDANWEANKDNLKNNYFFLPFVGTFMRKHAGQTDQPDHGLSGEGSGFRFFCGAAPFRLGGSTPNVYVFEYPGTIWGLQSASISYGYAEGHEFSLGLGALWKANGATNP